tara:strand:+ start:1920 stop:2735 length:816 start_codon:yes stop_codon:yes gene_type:complete
MQKINFIKMHGLGNDFVIIDNRNKLVAITDELIKKLSDRRRGAGCDQLITINNPKGKEDVIIEIYNASGDKAEACGNGTRCVAKLIMEEKNENSVNILSDAGLLKAKRIDKNNISVNMGKISNEWNHIPLSEKLDTLNIPINIEGFTKGVAVNVGNPHIVFFGKDLNNLDLLKLGPEIEHHKFFPNKTNVEFIKIINSKTIEMKVWERGVGITYACGSGACAAVFAGIKKNLLSNHVEVKLLKGSLNISIVNDEAIMSGPAEISYHGKVEI